MTRKLEMMGAWERRTARPRVVEFLASLPPGPVGAADLHNAYTQQPGAYPLGRQNFGILLTELGVRKCRSNSGIFYTLD